MSNLQLKREVVPGVILDSGRADFGAVDSITTQATELACAFIANNAAKVEDCEAIMAKMTQAVLNAWEKVQGNASAHPNLAPAVAIEDSVTDDYLICLEDGKRLQMLKRHLKTVYNMTVEQYKERWGLSADYPVVAPSYARRRSAIAKTTGLGSGRKKKAA